jgi:hypothetical protein
LLDRLRRADLLQEILVPPVLYLNDYMDDYMDDVDVCSRSLQNRIDQIVVQASAETGLRESVERRAGGATRNQPWLQIGRGCRRVRQ